MLIRARLSLSHTRATNTRNTGADAQVHKPEALAPHSCFLRGRSSCSAIHALRRDIKASIKRARADLETNMPSSNSKGFKEGW